MVVINLALRSDWVTCALLGILSPSVQLTAADRLTPMHAYTCPPTATLSSIRMPQDRTISRLRTRNFQLKNDLPNVESLCREVEAGAIRLAAAQTEV